MQQMLIITENYIRRNRKKVFNVIRLAQNQDFKEILMIYAYARNLWQKMEIPRSGAVLPPGRKY